MPGTGHLCPQFTAGKMLVDKDGAYCAPAEGAAFSCILAETFGTFVFISVVLSIKFHNGGPADALSCLAAGGTLFGAASIAAPITGAAINPAVGIVQTIFQSMMWSGRDFSVTAGTGPAAVKFKLEHGYAAIYIYIVGPLLGGILAGLWSKMNESVLEIQKPANEMESGTVDPSSGYNYAPENGF